MHKNITENLRFFRDRIHAKELQLERVKLCNEQIQELNAKRLQAELVLQKVAEYVDDLCILRAMVVSESQDYKQRRLEYLNNSITEEIANIFPEEEFKAKIETDFKHGSDKARLVLLDKNGNKRIPKITEGKLYQYTLSFSSTVGTIKALNYHNIFVDEAFGVASQEKLVKLSGILGGVLYAGIQTILVSQRSELYQSLPRREFRLYKEYETDSVIDTNSGNVIQVATAKLGEVVDID